MKLDGYWPLIDSEGKETTFYTKVYADIYIEISTGKEYTKGKIKPFLSKKGVKSEYPTLIEETDNFRFHTRKVKPAGRGPNIVEEIYINNLLDSLFKKK